MISRLLTRLRAELGGYLWGRTFAAGGLRTWLHEPVVRRHVNEAISGSPDRWPVQWLMEQIDGRCFDRALSLGCGRGALERDLVSKGVCRTIEGIDISRRALALAREAAAAEGLDGITYGRGDLNRLELPRRSYDGVFFHQALHHVENLDHCLATVAASLEPGGLLYLDEYVGPSRRERSEDLLAPARELFARLPPEVKRSRTVLSPLDRHDPTEAVRSSEILPAVSRRFRIVKRRDYGGNFLALIHPHLDLGGVSDAERDSILRNLVDAERRHLEAGARSFYTVVIAVPLEDGSEMAPTPDTAPPAAG
jgi:SAM-dependent methyltransferase